MKTLTLLTLLVSLTFAGQMITINNTGEVNYKLGLTSMGSNTEQTVCVETTLTTEDIISVITSFNITTTLDTEHGNIKCFYMFRN